MDIQTCYNQQTMTHHAVISQGDIQSNVCSDSREGLTLAIDEAVGLIKTGKITKQEPVFYNSDEADIDRQIAAMRPKEPQRQSIYSSSSSSSSVSAAPFIAMGFLAGVC